jgi:hypothetical protein
MAAINPVLIVTGTRAVEGPSEQDREKNLPEYVRTIRNRNLGKVTSDDRRITLLAMQYAYPILGKKSEKEVVDLLGSPDQIIVTRGQTGYIYRTNGLEGGNQPTLFFSKG